MGRDSLWNNSDRVLIEPLTEGQLNLWWNPEKQSSKGNSFDATYVCSLILIYENNYDDS